MIHDEKKIRSHYRDGILAQEYISKRFMKPLGQFQHQTQVETINHAIRFYNTDNILEVACGPARLTADIKGLKKGIAIDSSEQMLKIARQRIRNPNKWQFIKKDAFNIDLKDRFQLIYSFRFIRHFRFPERVKLYKTFYKILEPKGIILFDAVHYKKIAIVRKMEDKGQKEIYDKIYLDPVELEEELKNVGYEILTLKGIIHHFYLQASISRISNKLKKDNLGIKIIKYLERYPFGRPLEWIIVCRKRYS